MLLMLSANAVQLNASTLLFNSEDDKKQLLQEVLANAPSAFNLQHWRPVIVEDAELRQKFARLLGTNHK